MERNISTRSNIIDVKDGRKNAENIAPSKNVVNSKKAKTNITSSTNSLKPSNKNKESEPKYSDKKTSKFLKAFENEKTLVCSKNTKGGIFKSVMYKVQQ